MIPPVFINPPRSSLRSANWVLALVWIPDLPASFKVPATFPDTCLLSKKTGLFTSTSGHLDNLKDSAVLTSAEDGTCGLLLSGGGATQKTIDLMFNI